MNLNKQHNHHINFKLKGWGKKASGLFIDNSDEWFLLINNPVDYVCDGFILLNKHVETERTYKINDEWLEKVLILKAKKIKQPKINLSSTYSVLRSLKNLNSIIGVWDFVNSRKTTLWVGKIQKISKVSFTLIKIDTHAIRTTGKIFKFKNPMVIEFDSDYMNTMTMIVNKNN